MEEHDVVTEFEDIIKDLLVEYENLLKSEIDQYSKSVSSCCNKILNQKKSQLDLKKSLLEHQDNNESMLKREKELEKEIAKLQEAVEFPKVKCENLSKKLKNLTNIDLQQQAEMEDIFKLNKEKDEDAKSSSQHIIDKLALYKKFLGLEIRPLKNNRTQFIFHNALTDSPDIIFVIVQLIDKVYYVVDSEPQLDNFKELEEQLNQTNDLAAFVQHVRKLLLNKEENTGNQLK